MAHPELTRRDRRKERTRQALRAAAQELFRQHGYAGTTVEQIADAADVSPRTFFRYFPAKEDLLLPDLTELFGQIEQAIAARPAREHPLDTALEATVAVLAGSAGALITIAPELDPGNPAIVNRLVKIFLAWETRLAELLTERLRVAGDPAGDAQLRGTVTAHIAVATTRAAIRTLRQRAGDSAARPGELAAVARAAFAIARAGSGPLPS